MRFAVHCFISFEKHREHREQLKSAALCSNTCADALAWQLNISYIISHRNKSLSGGREGISF